MQSPNQNSDRLYWALLVVVVILIAALVYRQVQLSGFANQGYWELLLGDPVAISLLALSVALLLWQASFALRYRPYRLVDKTQLPKITVIIPAFNEGQQVLATVKSVIRSRYPRRLLEVICIDDGSQDDTWLWMQNAQAQFPAQVSLIRQPHNKGKRAALMEGFARASGEIVITVDSDSELWRDTLHHLVSPFVLDERVGSVAGNVRVLNLDEGAIPRMMEVCFTCAFDFMRAGQSVFGGVFCTPGALSAYRVTTLKPVLDKWLGQTFLGKPATIGEDRALTNLLLAQGHRVVYQRDAVVLTKVPTNFTGLRKMLLRWARSNVRENLTMLTFALRNFRPRDTGAIWVRLFCVTQLIRMTLIEGLKCAIIVRLLMDPSIVLTCLIIGAAVGAIVPSIVHFCRYRGTFGVTWALPFSYYWLVCLSWISLWGMFTATNSGWLTRALPSREPKKLILAPLAALPNKAA